MRRTAGCGDRRVIAPGDDELMSSAQLYDTIGAAYTVTRRTEPRIAEQVWAALGDARTVLNVGAGTGSYEPPDRDVTAVEPSARHAGATPRRRSAVPGCHLRRAFRSRTSPSTPRWLLPPSITGRTRSRACARCGASPAAWWCSRCDASDPDRFWLTRDYLPEHADLWAGRPSLTELARAIAARTEPVPIPWDCADGFYEAYWRRPEAYLDDHVRRGMSIWARVGPDAEQRAVCSLRDDLASGRWAERNRDLLDLDAASLHC